MASKKKDDVIEIAIEKALDRSQTFNPLLNALRENDKKHLFATNVTTAFHKTGFHLFDYYFGSVINIHNELGEIIKQEPRVGQAAGTFNLFIGNTGSGKAQPLSTKIPTPTGYKLMGDLKVGDKVFGSDGETTTVEGVFPQGEKDVYKITFGDGRTAMSTEDHLWEVIVYNHGKKRTKVLSLKEIMKDYKSKTDLGNRNRKYRIPTLSGPVQYEHQDVPIDPYVLGVIIGNGCLGEKALSVSDATGEISEKVAKRLGLVANRASLKNYTCNFHDPDSWEKVTTSDFFADLPEMVGKMSHNKEIPEIYLYNDTETRWELLRGLMDTDGSITYSEGRYNVSYSSCSKKLLKQIIELSRSLGFNATISIDSRNDKYRHGFHGSLIFAIPNDLKPWMFTVGYKSILASDAKHRAKHRDYYSLTIREIEFSHKEECQCIKVSAHDHLYVTEQFIVTHNTTLAAQIAGNIIRQFPYSNVIHYDCENRFDVSRCETITQLPASFFDNSNGPERYMIKTGLVGLDIIQEMIVKTYVSKMKLKHEMVVPSGFKNEFGKDVMIFQPTVIIIDSITSVINETFNPESSKDVSDAEKMRGNTEGARDAKTMKGFFKDILPLCKEANIIVFGINHINSNMSMNSFIPVAKQQNYLKQDESIPGGKTMLYYPFNIVKLIAKPSDDFTEESDGFAGHMVMIEPIKSSSNQSGNNSKGISFEMVFSFKYGFDPLRTMILYGKEIGAIEGNKTRMKFKEDDSFTFNLKNILKEKDEKPIWENLKKYVFPHLNTHLSFIEPAEVKFDNRALDY